MPMAENMVGAPIMNKSDVVAVPTATQDAGTTSVGTIGSFSETNVQVA